MTLPLSLKPKIHQKDTRYLIEQDKILLHISVCLEEGKKDK